MVTTTTRGLKIEETKNENFRRFLFFGRVKVLTELQTGRKFSMYQVKSKEKPIVPDGWSLSEELISAPGITSLINPQQTIGMVIDSVGNKYYELPKQEQ